MFKKLGLTLFLLIIALSFNPVHAKQICKNGKCMEAQCSSDNICKFIMDVDNQKSFMYIDLLTGAYFTRSYELKNGAKLFNKQHGNCNSKQLEIFRNASGKF